MKLIDADALKKHYAWWEDDRQKLFDSIVDSQPTVNAVEVVANGDKLTDEDLKKLNHDRPLLIMTSHFCDGVDAVPVRRGKWIKGSETKRIKENRYGVLFDAYYCSACESEAYWDSDYGQILFHYCPNCGARMDAE